MIKCPNCSKELENGTKFCDGCGAKIVETTFCPNCGARNSVDCGFCQNCGAPLSEATPSAPVSTPASNGAKKIDLSNLANTVLDKLPKNLPFKVTEKTLKIGVSAVAVVLVLAILLSIIGSGASYDSNYVMYRKDGELFYSKLSNPKPVEVTKDLDYDSTNYFLCEDGKTIFFIDDDGGLYTRNIKKKNGEVTKLEKSSVNYFHVSENEKLITYLCDDGDLYQHNLRERTKIESDVKEFRVTDNGKKLIYVTDDSDLYVKKGKNAEKIDGDIEEIVHVDEKIDIIYYLKDDSLYKKDGNKDKEKIAGDVAAAVAYESGELYYTVSDSDESKLIDFVEIDSDSSEYDDYVEYLEETTSYISTVELHYYDGKKATLVSDSVSNTYGRSYEEPMMVCSLAGSSDKIKLTKIAEECEDEYDAYDYIMDEIADSSEKHLIVEDKMSTFDQSEAYNFIFSEDGKTIYFIDNEDDGYGDLYELKVSGKKAKKAKLYDSDVYADEYGFLENGKLVYFKDVDEGMGEMYVDKKKADDDVVASLYRILTDGNNLIYIADWSSKNANGTLRMYKGGKAKNLVDDVSAFDVTPDGKILYLTDYEDGEGDLYLYKSSKSKMIDSDVSSIVSVYMTKDYDTRYR